MKNCIYICLRYMFSNCVAPFLQNTFAKRKINIGVANIINFAKGGKTFFCFIHVNMSLDIDFILSSIFDL